MHLVLEPNYRPSDVYAHSLNHSTFRSSSSSPRESSKLPFNFGPSPLSTPPASVTMAFSSQLHPYGRAKPNSPQSSSKRSLASITTSSFDERHYELEGSVLASISRYNNAVNSMNETVMLPSKLMDVPVRPIFDSRSSSDAHLRAHDDPEKPLRSAESELALSESSTDLFSHYVMLKELRTFLISGGSDQTLESAEDHSLTSSGNSTDSDRLSSSTHVPPASVSAACSAVRHHFSELNTLLKGLTEDADSLTERYAREIDPST